MAGAGPAPKPREQRRRYGQPARSEWVELEPLKEPVLPPYPKAWLELTKAVPKWVWDLWRQDSVTTQYAPADHAAILMLGERFDRLQPNEQRLRMDELGLSPKGRRDLRWRNPAEVVSAKKAQERAAQVRKLRVVADTPKEKTA